MLNKTTLSKINASWHLSNKMPKNPSLEERIKWHIEHSQNCKCRPMDPKIVKEIEKRNEVEERKRVVVL